MSQSRMVQGTFLLSAAIFLSKFLGLLFVIPFEALVGREGGLIYQYAYVPYTIMSSIATVGIPLAVSKYVAKYNALGDYKQSKRLLRTGLPIMMATGLAGFLILFFAAPAIAKLSLGPVADEWGILEDVVFVIRIVSLAILIVPSMSILRGYFQGFESMKPTAVSQTVEQFVRIGFGLTAAFIVIVIFNGSKTLAVAMVALGAFGGALASMFILLKNWLDHKPHLDQLLSQNKTTDYIPFRTMYRELISYAIPFVCVGLSMQLYLLIDQFTVNHFMPVFHDINEETLKSYVSNLLFYDQKLIMIPVSLATAMALSAVPAVTSSFSTGDAAQVQQKITQAFQFIVFLILPVVCGMVLLGEHLYVTLYGLSEASDMGGNVLQWYAPSAFLFASFTVSASILQGLEKQKVTIFSLIVGLLLKLLLNPLFIKWFGTAGPILATDFGYLAAVSINLFTIKRRTGYRFNFIAKRFLLAGLFTGFMAIGVGVIVSFADAPQSWMEAAAVTVGGALLGVVIYLYLALRSGLAKQVFGRRIPFLSRWM